MLFVDGFKLPHCRMNEGIPLIAGTPQDRREPFIEKPAPLKPIDLPMQWQVADRTIGFRYISLEHDGCSQSVFKDAECNDIRRKELCGLFVRGNHVESFAKCPVLRRGRKA